MVSDSAEDDLDVRRFEALGGPPEALVLGSARMAAKRVEVEVLTLVGASPSPPAVSGGGERRASRHRLCLRLRQRPVTKAVAGYN